MMSENIEQLQSLLGCEVLPIDPKTSPQQMMETYLTLWEQGKKEKFTPIIVTADDTLIDKFQIELEDEDLPFSAEGMSVLREKIITEASQMHGQNFYQAEKSEMQGMIDEDSINWEVPEEEELLFSSCLETYDEENPQLMENVAIAKIPTDRPYEVFAWLPMGGFNDCPLPSKMLAIARYWYEKHGAEPSTLTYDTVEFYLPNPTDDKKALIELAMEQYLFDVDIVEQGVGDVESLIETLYLNKQWFFWWD